MERKEYTMWQMFFVSILSSVATIALGLATYNVWATLAMIAIFSFFFTIMFTEGVRNRLRVVLVIILAIIFALLVMFFRNKPEEKLSYSDTQEEPQVAIQDDTEEEKEEEEKEEEPEQKVEVQAKKKSKIPYDSLTDKMAGSFSSSGGTPSFAALTQRSKCSRRNQFIYSAIIKFNKWTARGCGN